jgi:hypothetical protein
MAVGRNPTIKRDVYLAWALAEDINDVLMVFMILFIDSSSQYWTDGKGILEMNQRIEILQDFAKSLVIYKSEKRLLITINLTNNRRK